MKKIIVDLSGPRGNTSTLLMLTRQLGRHLGKNVPEIEREMTESDYPYSLEVFKREFEAFVELKDKADPVGAGSAQGKEAQR